MKHYGQMRIFRIAAVVTLCVFGGVLAGGLACSSSSQDGADESKGGESARASADLVDQVNEILQLRSSSIIALDIDPTPGVETSVNLLIAGEQYTLDLHPQSVRAANYQVLVQLADGSLVEVEPGPERTLRGTVVGVEGSAVAASMEEDGLHARIFLSDGEQYWVEPVASRVPQAGPNHYVVYHNDDIIAPEKACGLDQLPDALGDRGVLGTVRQTRTGACGTGLCVAELAVDADFEYYEAYGSVAAVESRINSVINAVNIQYERDVDITQVLSAIIVRAAEPDPYTFTDATQLLFQFRDHWLANHSNIQRDMAELFTGKELNSSTIGIAWLNAVCTNFGFSVVQSDFNNNFGCTTDLTAHELGHNWGANHCQCTNNTMNAFITCSNKFHGTFTIPEIVSFRDSRACLQGESACLNDEDCDDGDLCTDDTCSGGSCSNTPVSCDDGNDCNGMETCDPGSGNCLAGTPLICDDGDPCNGTETCDTATGQCVPGDPNTGCCGNGTCESGETCNNCAADCISGTTSGAVCGNGICEAGDGEDCLSCSADCNGKQNQRPSGRFCCGDGDGENPVDCGDSRCTSGNWECTDVPSESGTSFCCGDTMCEGDEDSSNCETDCGAPPTCGDGTCDPGEDQCNCAVDCPGTCPTCGDGSCASGEDRCNCAADCGMPPADETGQCNDGVDNDCDGAADCNDSDCIGDPACSCLGNRSPCTSNSQCCSNNCKTGTCRGN